MTNTQQGREQASRRRFGRRVLLTAAGGLLGAAIVFRRKVVRTLAKWTELADFYETPPLKPHDPVLDRRTLFAARGGGPAANVDSVLDKMGGIEKIVGPSDVVIIKVCAQW